MTQSNGDPRMYSDPSTAALGERVTNLGRRQSDLEGEMRAGFRAVEQQISSFTAETRTAIAGIGTSLADRNKPQWRAIGVAITFATIIGALAYWPIRESTADLKQTVRDQGVNSLSVASFIDFKSTYENNRIVSRNEYIDKFNNVNARVDKISESQVPREEHERVWQSYDLQLQNLLTQLTQQRADLQRQIDEGKQVLGNTYSLRDYIQRLTDRIDQLENRALRGAAPPVMTQ